MSLLNLVLAHIVAILTHQLFQYSVKWVVQQHEQQDLYNYVRKLSFSSPRELTHVGTNILSQIAFCSPRSTLSRFLDCADMDRYIVAGIKTRMELELIMYLRFFHSEITITQNDSMDSELQRANSKKLFINHQSIWNKYQWILSVFE